MKQIFVLIFTVFLSIFAFSCNKSSDSETAGEKLKEVGNDAERSADKTIRDVKDEACEMVNGKMECAADKVKHSVQDGADAVEDAVD